MNLIINPQIQSKYSYPKTYSNINFTGIETDIFKTLRSRLEKDGNITQGELNKHLAAISPDMRQRLIDTAKPFSQYGVDVYTMLKKCAFQPFIISSKSDTIIKRIKSLAFVERHKTGKSLEDIIPYVVEKKNLGYGSERIYMPLIVNKVFKTSGRPKCFVDESGMYNAFKRFYRQNKEPKFDDIEILKDEMSDDFINFVKKLSFEISGNENLIRVILKDNLNPTLEPEALKENKKPTVREILAHLKYQLNETQSNTEIINLYTSLPETYHKNFSSLLIKLKNQRNNLNMYDLLQLYVRNSFFFNMNSQDAINLIKVKQFTDKNIGKEYDNIKTFLKTVFFPTPNANAYYSHLLISKIFSLKSEMPWYLRKTREQDLTEDLKLYLSQNPNCILNFDIKDDEMAMDFINYVKRLSTEAVNKNIFTINITK